MAIDSKISIIVTIIFIVIVTYKVTKSGMVDDAWKFIKHEIFKVKR